MNPINTQMRRMGLDYLPTVHKKVKNGHMNKGKWRLENIPVTWGAFGIV